MSAKNIENLSHALLTDRDSADQHPLGAITGLESALTTLTVDHHAIGRYASDSKEACSSSVQHASIAVAEAAYIESILKNLKTFVGDLSEQEERINELIAQAEAQISTIESSVQYVQNAEKAVAKDAKDAALYAEVSQQVLTKLDTVPEMLAEAAETKAVASAAASSAEKAAQAAVTSAENIELFSQQITVKVDAAESAADRAELYANTLGETAENALNAANETMEAAQIILESVDGYKEACTSAEESADDASAYASAAAEYSDQAAEYAKIVTDNAALLQDAIDTLIPAVETIDTKVAEAAAYAESARQSAEEAKVKFAGAVRLCDPVATEDDLPENPEHGDLVRVEKTGTHYLWDGATWQSFSSDLQWYASVDELPVEADEMQELLDSLYDGAYISVIPGL